MTHQSIRFPRFYVTPPAPCPYLPDRAERKVFTELNAADACSVNDALTQIGFRRSQNVIYRPACEDCVACKSVRVVVHEFKPNKSMRRLLRNNHDIIGKPMPAWATDEQFSLLQRYLGERHPDGGMMEMDAIDYASMVESSPIETLIVEYRLTEPDGGFPADTLVATCLSDILGDGLSLIYSFFEPELATRSLGTHVILSHIDYARKLGLPYVYLGYWINECRKMSYKTRFRPLEVLAERGWVRFET